MPLHLPIAAQTLPHPRKRTLPVYNMFKHEHDTPGFQQRIQFLQDSFGLWDTAQHLAAENSIHASCLNAPQNIFRAYTEDLVFPL